MTLLSDRVSDWLQDSTPRQKNKKIGKIEKPSADRKVLVIYCVEVRIMVTNILA